MQLLFGAGTPPPTSLTNMATHMVFIQLRGSHQLVAHRAQDSHCYPVSTVGDAMELPRALYTRASLTFQTGTKRSFAVLISILHPGSVGRALKRLAPGTLPKRVLQSIHLIRPRDLNHTWSSGTSSFSLQTAPTNSSSVIKIFTLNVQHTITSKLAPLRHFIEFHEFPELLCLQEIGTTSATFHFHPLYEPFFTVGVCKCLGVAILIRRVASFSYVKSEIRSDGGGVAVWFSMYGTPFLAVGLYLHASGQYEDYEPLLSWAQALVISTPDAWCVVLGDRNRNPGWVMGFPHAPPDLSDLFDQFVLDASLTRADFTCVSPTWVGSQGWSNVLDYILVRIPTHPPKAFIHSSSPFPSDHSPVSLSLPLRVKKQEPKIWETKQRYHIPEKIPAVLRQRFNSCFAQQVPPGWQDHAASDIFCLLQRGILSASEAVFGPPGSSSSTPSVVVTQQRNLSDFLIKHPRWWASIRQVTTFLQIREQIHSAWRVIGLERQLGAVPLRQASEPPSGSSYWVIYRKPYT